MVVRATYGSDGVDDRLVPHVQQVRSVKGRKLGLYHFGYPDPGVDAEREADHFLTIAGRFSPDFLALDLEVRDGLEGHGDDALETWGLTFMNRVAGRSAVPVLFYTFASWLHIFGRVAAAHPRSLWVAHWQVSQPDHLPWKSWTFWQTGALRGLDHDVFNGSRDALDAWLGEGGEDEMAAVDDYMHEYNAGQVIGLKNGPKPDPDKNIAGARGWNSGQVILAAIKAQGGAGGVTEDRVKELIESAKLTV